MFISDEFVDSQGIKILFPNANQDQIDEMFSANVFGVPSRFGGSDVVARVEAERAGKAVFQSSKQQKIDNHEPEKPQYSDADQKQLNINNDVIARYGNHKSEEDQFRVLMAKKRVRAIEGKYSQPEIDKAAIQQEIDRLEEQRLDLINNSKTAGYGTPYHNLGDATPAQQAQKLLSIKRQIADLKKQL